MFVWQCMSPDFAGCHLRASVPQCLQSFYLTDAGTRSREGTTLALRWCSILQILTAIFMCQKFFIFILELQYSVPSIRPSWSGWDAPRVDNKLQNLPDYIHNKQVRKHHCHSTLSSRIMDDGRFMVTPPLRLYNTIESFDTMPPGARYKLMPRDAQNHLATRTTHRYSKGKHPSHGIGIAGSTREVFSSLKEGSRNTNNASAPRPPDSVSERSKRQLPSPTK
jgi:hypothetical protein